MIEFLRLPVAYREAISSMRWLAELPDAVRESFVASGRRRAVAEGEYLYRRGEPYDGFFGVLEGTVRVSGNSTDGQETILDLYGPGAWFGEVAALTRTPRMQDAVAVSRVEVIQIPQAALERLLDAHPELTAALLRLEANRLRLVLLALEGYSAQSIEKRLANRVLLLAEAHGVRVGGHVEVRLSLTQETLARLIGSTRQRVGQVLNSWRDAGILVHTKGTLVILQHATLERLAEL